MIRDRHHFVLVSLVAALAGAVLLLAPRTRTLVHEVNEARVLPAGTHVSRRATMVFAGDIMLSRSVGELMAARQDWLWPFRSIASVTAGADLAFANLETTISAGDGPPQGCLYCFRADPRAVQGLVYAGFDVLSVANNHIWDYGSDAFTDTLGHLARAGIDAVGGGADDASARAPVFRDVGGTRVAFLAYTNLLSDSAGAGPGRPGANRYDDTRMKDDIAVARDRSDIVIVSFHAGDEYREQPNQWQRKAYHTAIDSGADLVIGHHPHVIQALERYRDGWIAYSLGNFVFDQTFSPETMTSVLLSVTVRDGAIMSVTPLTVHISRRYQPSLTDSPDAR